MTQVTYEQALDLAWQHFEAGRLQESESICRQVLQVSPNHPEALQVLGVLAHTVKRYDVALQLLNRSVELLPSEGKFHHNLAETLSAVGRYEDAIASYRRAIEIANFPQSWSYMGNVLLHVGRAREALEAHRQAVALVPGFAKMHCNFGVALQAQGQVAEAIAEFREAVRLDPTLHGAHSNVLYAMHYTRDQSPVEIFEAHRAWGRQHAADAPVKRDSSNDRSQDRRVRIGFVSADLVNHPVGRFLLPLFQHRDAENSDFICFSGAASEDHVSREIQQRVQGWHHTHNLDDEQLAALIVENRIDILVDLAGHTSGSRLLVFARKPAPVQVSYLGYPNSTGLDAIDYRITDAWADPTGESDGVHTEKLMRLPRSFLCYSAPPEAPPISSLPAEQNVSITFGSFNYFPKISPEISAIWQRVLNAIPDSRLLIKSRHLDYGSREEAMQLLASRGLPADRVSILPRDPNPPAHLAKYSKIDIALDTFPYHGTTTTCESLWMGVPVVTLAGETHVSRVGVSILQNAGMPELIANNADEYVDIATKLAQDTARLKSFRANARERMQASPLMDAQGFARDMQIAFREMWHAWCST